jgi:hypothetical protein
MALSKKEGKKGNCNRRGRYSLVHKIEGEGEGEYYTN